MLLSFLNAVFEDAEQPLIQSVELLNPFIDKDALSDKLAVLDVKARTETGTLIDVEVQLRNGQDMEKRTLYYWSKLFQNQLEEGDSHRQLHKAVTINVLDFDYLPTPQYHSTFHARDDTAGLLLTDLFEVHFIELRKLQAQSVGLERRLVRWMLFFTTKTRERLEELAMPEPAIKKALTTLEFLSQDREARALYEERQKGLMTYQTDMEGYREEGRLLKRSFVRCWSPGCPSNKSLKLPSRPSRILQRFNNGCIRTEGLRPIELSSDCRHDDDDNADHGVYPSLWARHRDRTLGGRQRE